MGLFGEMFWGDVEVNVMITHRCRVVSFQWSRGPCCSRHPSVILLLEYVQTVSQGRKLAKTGGKCL